MGVIFKDMYDMAKDIKRKINSDDNYFNQENEIEKFRLIKEIRDYFMLVVNAEDEVDKDSNIYKNKNNLNHFIKRTDGKKRLYVILKVIEKKGNFKYKVIAEELGYKSEMSLRNTMKYYSDQAKAVIGYNTLSLINNNEIETARFQFHKGIGLINQNLFIEGLENLLPNSKQNLNIKLEDCLDLLKLLRVLTNQGIKNQLEKFDEDKLKHVLYVIFTDDSLYRDERKLIYQYLNYEISIEDFKTGLANIDDFNLK